MTNSTRQILEALGTCSDDATGEVLAQAQDTPKPQLTPEAMEQRMIAILGESKTFDPTLGH